MSCMYTQSNSASDTATPQASDLKNQLKEEQRRSKRLEQQVWLASVRNVTIVEAVLF
jgi:radical SAM superfamily enzyme